MKSLAFFNNKGGVGKTTLLCNVASFIALNRGKKVCVVDCDPQCNSTHYMFKDKTLSDIYADGSHETIYKSFEGISKGQGYSPAPRRLKSTSFGVSVICGDPRLSLSEDLLAEDWGKIGSPRGLRTTLVFEDLLDKLGSYEYVFFDVSPSLGALNRSILLAADAFVSPISIDIFSLKAFENISKWMENWHKLWDYSVNSPALDSSDPIVKVAQGVSPSKFLGYVTQQYVARKDRFGQRRAVQSYESIIRKIDGEIQQSFPLNMRPADPMEIGTIPNLYSLVPMSQSSRKPIFSLTAEDKVVGAHFGKIKESYKILEAVSDSILDRLDK